MHTARAAATTAAGWLWKARIALRTSARPTLLLVGAVAVLVVVVALALQVAGLVFCGITGAVPPADVTPLTFYRYWYWYSHHEAWQMTLYASAGVGVFALLLPVGIVLAPSRDKKLHGDARWATRRQIRAAGLFGQAGIIVGKRGGSFLLFDGTAQGKNVMVAAAPGSGKTQGLMIPNCLNWPGSLVALDIKGECFAASAGYRESLGQSVCRLDFLSRDYRTHQYDPFAYVSTDRNFRVGDIEKIANYLCPNPPPPADPFWAAGARDMFRAIALYLLDTKQPCTLGGILDVVETTEELKTFAKRIVKEVADSKLVLDAQSVRDFAKIGERPDKTHGGVKDQLTAALAPLKNPLVRFATSGNTFDLRTLRSKRVSIYVCVARPDIAILRPIINLFFQQLTDLNMLVEFGKAKDHRHELLLALDEFAQIGRLDAIFEGITFFRSFGIRALVLLQSPSQARTIYSTEGAKTFEQSFDCSVFYTPAARDIETAELVSRLLGYQTVKGRSESKRKSFETKNDSTSTSDQKRALMLPQEVLRMPLEREIVFISGVPPIFAKKVRAWVEPQLLGRKGAPPETPLIPLRLLGYGVDEKEAQAEVRAEASKASKSLNGVARAADKPVVERPIEANDMPLLDELTADDYLVAFDEVVVPRGKLSETQVKALAGAFTYQLIGRAIAGVNGSATGASPAAKEISDDHTR